MSAVDHARMHSTTGRVCFRLKCPCCGKVFEREKRRCGYGKKLVFCTRQCVGRFGFKTHTSADIEKAKKENIIEEFIPE